MTERNRLDDLHLTDEEVLGLAYGEASDEVRQWWEIHRQHCKACAEAVEMTMAVAEREAQMPPVKLTPAEERSVLDRITGAISPRLAVPKKQPGLLMALLEKMQQGWEVSSFLALPATVRGGDKGPENDSAPFRITADDSGTLRLVIAVGKDYAGKAVRVTGDEREFDAVLNAEGEATLTLPANSGESLTVYLVAKS